ncbi:MAG: DNA repair protein [Firmicutes bacterium]|nr:DNA repair protein [Bacillota bacterium]
MNSAVKQYLCIDLKSFYASVECVERNLDSMTTDLVVADPDRSDKTICLAVSPSLKAKGVRNRCRVFEIPKNLNYIMAPPRMQKYIDYAAEIYGIYLRYISKDDIHVYSIDEVFMDVTPYLRTYGMTAREMAVMLMGKVFEETGIRATCGIGTNLYLAKIALDITAKHAKDFIGELDEDSFREKLWDHRPLTDFWRIGRGTERSLAEMGIYTMRQLAAADEEMLYRKYGVDAELLIDHAWGREPVEMRHIKEFRPQSSSFSSGQVLMRDYAFGEARVVLEEMVYQLCLDMTAKEMLASSMTFYAGYSNALHAEPSGGTAGFGEPTNSASVIIPAVLTVFDSVVDRDKPIRRFGVSANDLKKDDGNRQLNLFDYAEREKAKEHPPTLSVRGRDRSEEEDLDIQKAVLAVKEKFGKNAVFKGLDLQEGATALERNRQIGGHKSGE